MAPMQYNNNNWYGQANQQQDQQQDQQQSHNYPQPINPSNHQSYLPPIPTSLNYNNGTQAQPAPVYNSQQQQQQQQRQQHQQGWWHHQQNQQTQQSQQSQPHHQTLYPLVSSRQDNLVLPNNITYSHTNTGTSSNNGTVNPQQQRANLEQRHVNVPSAGAHNALSDARPVHQPVSTVSNQYKISDMRTHLSTTRSPSIPAVQPVQWDAGRYENTRTSNSPQLSQSSILRHKNESTNYRNSVATPVMSTSTGLTHTESVLNESQSNATQLPTTVEPTSVYDPWRVQQEVAERKRMEEEQIQRLKEAREAAEALAAQKQAEERQKRESEDRKQHKTTEDEVRAMFLKMRQFNQADPGLLARLWEEERTEYARTAMQSNETDVHLTSTQVDSGPRNKPNDKMELTKSKQSMAGPSNKAMNQAETAPKPIVTDQRAKASSMTSAPTVATPTSTTSTTNHPANVIAPARRRILATVAADYLNEFNAGRGKSTTISAIESLLYGNPSYPSLCSLIDTMGLKYEMYGFARKLLGAVPDLNKTSSDPRKAKITLDTKTPTTPLQPQQTSSTKSAVARESAVGLKNPVQKSLNSSVLPPSPASMKKPNSSTKSSKPVTPIAPSVLSKPQSKEQAARKRTIGDLIDLTADNESDAEDIPPPKKFAWTDETNLPEHSDIPSQFKSDHLKPPDVTITNQNSRAFPGKVKTPQFRGQILVSSLDRAKAALKNSYDPRTIARDVLLATGKHPDMRPLNAHLMVLQALLQKNCESLGYSRFDLSTIRWDILDPGEPQVSHAVHDPGSEADDESDGGDGVSPYPRSTYGTVPNGGDGTMAVVVVDTPRLPIKRRAGRPSKSGILPRSSTSTSSPRLREHSGRLSVNSLSGNPIGYSAFRAQGQKFDADGNPIKRLGRPVGWRKHTHSKAAQAAMMSGQGSGSGSPSGNINTIKTDHDETAKKRRKAKELIDVTLKEDKKLKQVDMDIDIDYAVFKCQWQDCDAQLHNFETLKKHVNKIHGVAEDGKYACRWGECSTLGAMAKVKLSLVQSQDDPVDLPRHEFSTAFKWMSHVVKEHMSDVVHKLGEGPTSGLSGKFISIIHQTSI